MAIKVGGTTVVDDSRALTNVASIDATTAASISAAGVGGGGSRDFVASGAVSNGDLVGLNSDGTISTLSQALSSDVVVFNASSDSTIKVAYDTNSNKVLVVYKDGNTGANNAIVGTVSGGTITYGTPVAITSYKTTIDLIFDPNQNKFLYTSLTGNTIKYNVITISGTVPTVNSEADLLTGYSFYNGNFTFDSSSNKIIFGWTTGTTAPRGAYSAYAGVITISGTTASMGTPVAISSAGTDYQFYAACSYDAGQNKVLFIFRDAANSNYSAAVVGTVSGTSLSMGTKVIYTSANVGLNQIVYDTSANKTLLAFRSGTTGQAIIATISGTTPSFSSIFNMGSIGPLQGGITFDSTSNVSVIAGKSDSNDVSVLTAKINGSSISFSDLTVIDPQNGQEVDVVFDPDSATNVVIWTTSDSSPGYKVQSALFNAAALPANKFVGIAEENIANAATGACTIVGGVNSSQSGLTTSAGYYIQDSATITTTVTAGRRVGTALSATELLITNGGVEV